MRLTNFDLHKQYIASGGEVKRFANIFFIPVVCCPRYTQARTRGARSARLKRFRTFRAGEFWRLRLKPEAVHAMMDDG
jgi:hypothetical protein